MLQSYDLFLLFPNMYTSFPYYFKAHASSSNERIRLFKLKNKKGVDKFYKFIDHK